MWPEIDPGENFKITQFAIIAYSRILHLKRMVFDFNRSAECGRLGLPG
jgi:hypothetical protein